MLLVVETDEDAAHEAHVAVEIVDGRLAGIEIRSLSREDQVSIRNHATEVGDKRRIVTRIGARRRISVNLS